MRSPITLAGEESSRTGKPKAAVDKPARKRMAASTEAMKPIQRTRHTLNIPTQQLSGSILQRVQESIVYVRARLKKSQKVLAAMNMTKSHRAAGIGRGPKLLRA